ncbi:MAG: adenylosuccinate synthase [Candidatus Pacebacteria bacterium]|nr:adenylosuccinate synthase [Candidatus Paceibacterota bacterium]
MNDQKKGFVDVLVGLQWGDEGKGKNIDDLLLSKVYSGVARFQGGANAGHTLNSAGVSFIGHIIPSGCLHQDMELYIGSEVVVDVISLVKEIKELKEKGFDIAPRLYISNRAKLVSYMHSYLDLADEAYRSNTGSKIGTTARGIGPAYSDSRARRGLLIGDVMFTDFNDKVEKLSLFHNNLLKLYKEEYGFEIATDKIEESKKNWTEAIEELKKMNICDLSYLIHERLESGKNILAEGAQGLMLDIDFGDYPNVTSSNTLPANMCLGLGIPHSYIRNIYGVMKAYTTKVGGGNFPARIKDESIEKLFQDAGHEFGATTGRPRMCGWLDLFALEYAIKLSGVNKVFINKSDICPTDKVKVVTGYIKDGKNTPEFPLRLNEITDVVTEDLPGWGQENFGVTDKDKISPELKTYMEYVENKLKNLGADIVSVGTGPSREHTIDWNK